MEVVTKKRPKSVTVIGWIFIVGAVLMLFSGILSITTFTFMKQMGQGIPAMPEEMPISFQPLWTMFKYLGLLAFFQIVFALFVLIAAIQFLKLRAWARTALQVISWLGLLWYVGFGIFWVFAWLRITSSIPVAEGTPRLPPMFTIMGAVMGTVVVAVCTVPLIVIIVFLSGKAIKEAFA